MSPNDASELPNIAQVLGEVLQGVAADEQPLLIAVAERLAAARYRNWAMEVAEPTRQAELLRCAAREEQIASRVEALYPGAASTQRRILTANPDLEALNHSLFAGRPLAEQFTIQAAGERLGAATWRAFARRETRPEARDSLLACAALEEQSAVALEAMLRADAEA